MLGWIETFVASRYANDDGHNGAKAELFFSPTPERLSSALYA